MTQILHITPHLGGGVGQVVTNIVGRSQASRAFQHEILCLDHLSEYSRELCDLNGITAHAAVPYEHILDRAAKADIVHVEWWNHPLLNRFLYSVPLPAARTLFFSHISGYHPPAVFTQDALDMADIFCLSTPHSENHPLIQAQPKGKVRTIFIAGGSTKRVANVTSRPHSGFNVGYVGTVDFCKMHPDFLSMSAASHIPDVRFIICGEGASREELETTAAKLGVSNIFDFKGHVDDIAEVFSQLDVFGYPLNSNHYGTGEQALLEAMAAGVVPVAFDNGCEKAIIRHEETGLLVSTPQQYTAALEFLHDHPTERIRLGNNAKAYAAEHFTLEKTVVLLHETYAELLRRPKRTPAFFRPGTRPLPGHQVFLRAMGDTSPAFAVNAQAEDFEILLASDREIAASGSEMTTPTKGSVLHYAGYFPDDCQLLFWEGLIHLEKGGYREATDLFLRALDNDFPHWRIHWYLAQGHAALGNHEAAQASLETFRQATPVTLDTELVIQQLDMAWSLSKAKGFADALDTILRTPLPTPSPLDPFSPEGLVLYGAGKMGKMALDCMEQVNLRPEFIVDRGFEGDTIRRIPVITPDRVPEWAKEHMTFVICIATLSYNALAAYLRKLGCRDIRHFYDLSEAAFPAIMPNGWLLASPNRVRLETIGAALSHDPTSLSHFLQFLWWRIARREVADSAHPILSGRKFFKAPCMPTARKGEVLIDCGAHLGQTIDDFVEFTQNDYAQVLGFEPDPATFAQLSTRYSDPRIHLEQTAISSRDGNRQFRCGMDFASMFSDQGQLTVKTICLDSIPDGTVNYLKIHVEGDEMAVLQGGRTCIQTQRPVVMVLADHSSDGVESIPAFLMELERYRLFFNLHDYCGNSAIYYAIPRERLP